MIQRQEDKAAPPANGRDLKQRLDDRVTLVDVPDAGHALIVEQPDLVVRSIVERLHRHED